MPELHSIDTPFHDVEAVAKAEQESRLRDTKDLLQSALQGVPDLRMKMSAYVSSMMAKDADPLKLPKNREQQFIDMVASGMTTAVKSEAQRLLEATKGGKVKKEEVQKSADALKAVYEELRERERNSPRYKKEQDRAA